MKHLLENGNDTVYSKLLNPHGSDETSFHHPFPSNLPVFLTHTVQMKQVFHKRKLWRNYYFLTHTVQMKRKGVERKFNIFLNFLTHTVQMKLLAQILFFILGPAS